MDDASWAQLLDAIDGFLLGKRYLPLDLDPLHGAVPAALAGHWCEAGPVAREESELERARGALRALDSRRLPGSSFSWANATFERPFTSTWRTITRSTTAKD